MSGNRKRGGDRIAGSGVALPAAGPTRDLLDRAARLATRRAERLAWVGGGVRDLLLGRPTVDLDLAIEGDPAAFASELAADAGGRVVEHPRFLTVTVELPDGRTVDVARSRRESYPAPGALPQIEPAPLEADLARRDFSVNAIAVRLAPGPAELLDPLGAVADLAAGRLRILHPGSFHDDPTRILRGIRFEARFGFGFDSGTEAAARHLLGEGGLDTISGVRLRRELELTCESWPRLATTFERLAELGLLHAIDPDLTWSPEAGARIEKAAQFAREPAFADDEPRRWLVGLLGLDPPNAARLRLLARLAVGASEAEILRSSVARISAAVALLRPEADPAPHRVAQVLERASAEELCRIAANGNPAAGWVRRYLDELRPMSLQVRGQDLVRAGIPAGPEIGAALRATLEARQDGRIGAAEELEYARRACVRGEAG